MQTGFFLITRTPSPSTQAFAEALARRMPNVVLIADEPTSVVVPGADVVHVTDAELGAHGYTGANPLVPRVPSGWDKALLEAHRRGWERNWFCEDDVFFTSAEEAAAFVERWSASPADLLCEDFFTIDERPNWPHWDVAGGRSLLPEASLAAGFMPLARVSRRLLQAVNGVAGSRGRLVLFEMMLPTLVQAEGMSFELMTQLDRFIFRFRPDVSLDEVIAGAAGGLCVFHPVKDDRERARFTAQFASGRARRRWRVLLATLRALPRSLHKRHYARLKDRREKQSMARSRAA